MNPIETVWSILKEKIHKKNPKGKKELIDASYESWNEIDDDVVRGCIRRLHDQIRLVKANDGSNMPVCNPKKKRICLRPAYFKKK